MAPRRKLRSSLRAFFPIVFGLAAGLCGAASAGPSESAFTPDEIEIGRALEREFKTMGPRARILSGTRLFLNDPHRSKYYNVNSLGLRGPELQPKKKNGFNVMVMGGSTVFGDTYKADSQTIPALLEKLLRARHPDREITVHNAGVVGYEFQREIDLAKLYWKQLEPDLIVFYHGANNATAAYDQGYVQLRPFSTEDETYLARKTGKGVSFYQQMRHLRRRMYGPLRNFLPNEDPHLPEKRASLVRGYRDDAAGINQYFKKEGVPVLFVLQPMLATKADKTPAEAAIARSFDLEYPEFAEFYRGFLSEIKASASADDLEVHDFMDAFDFQPGEIYFDFVHVNLAGNKVIAERLCNLIEEKRLLDGAR